MAPGFESLGFGVLGISADLGSDRRGKACD